MKILTILVLVQTAVLLLVFGKIVTIENNMTPATLVVKNTSGAGDLEGKQSQSHSNDFYRYPNEDQLRQIIREELAAQLDKIPELAMQTGPATALNATDGAEYERRREQVTQQLNYYTSLGSISDVDMQKLQVDIASLDAASRREMLMELTRALNSGELEGRL